MATIRTTISPTPQLFPFSGLPDPEGDLSSVPRGELIFSIDPASDNVTEGDTADDQEIFLSMVLPQNFAYALMEIKLSLDGTVADIPNWDPVAIAAAVNGTTNRTMSAALQGVSNGIYHHKTGAGPAGRVYTFEGMTGLIHSPRASEQANVSIKWANTTVDGEAASVRLWCRFLVYDIAQIHHWAVQTAQLVR